MWTVTPSGAPPLPDDDGFICMNGKLLVVEQPQKSQQKKPFELHKSGDHQHQTPVSKKAISLKRQQVGDDEGYSSRFGSPEAAAKQEENQEEARAVEDKRDRLLDRLQGCPFPTGWYEARTNDNETFFINDDLRLTSWVDPRLGQLLKELYGNLPSGWEVDLDDNGHRYFIDHNTRTTLRVLPEHLQHLVDHVASIYTSPGRPLHSSSPDGSVAGELDDDGNDSYYREAYTDDLPVDPASIDIWDIDESNLTIPAGWEVHNQDGTPYYANEKAKKATWTHPGLCIKLFNLDPADLSSKWDVAIDSQGLYFLDTKSQTAHRFLPASEQRKLKLLKLIRDIKVESAVEDGVHDSDATVVDISIEEDDIKEDTNLPSYSSVSRKLSRLAEFTKTIFGTTRAFFQSLTGRARLEEVRPFNDDVEESNSHSVPSMLSHFLVKSFHSLKAVVTPTRIVPTDDDKNVTAVNNYMIPDGDEIAPQWKKFNSPEHLV